jgi:hypothetical protein
MGVLNHDKLRNPDRPDHAAEKIRQYRSLGERPREAARLSA